MASRFWQRLFRRRTCPSVVRPHKTRTIHLELEALETRLLPSGLQPNPVISQPESAPGIVLSTEGQKVRSGQTLLTFVDTDGQAALTHLTATITWGDGSPDSAVTSSSNGVAHIVGKGGNNFAVVTLGTGAHVYEEAVAGATFQIVVADDGFSPPAGSISASTPLDSGNGVSEVQITNLTGAATTQTIIQDASTTPITSVATFTDPAGAEPVGDYSATIDWGDGSTSAGTVVNTGGKAFGIDAPAHLYASAGVFTVNVAVQHETASVLTVVGATITVDEKPSKIVTTVNDEHSKTDGTISLREAITYAETLSGPQTVTFDPTVFIPANSYTLALTSSLPIITGNITIQWTGTGTLAIDGMQNQIFHVSGGASLTLSGLTVSDGKNAAGDGGAVLVDNGGSLTVQNCTLQGNSAANGGAVAVEGGAATSTLFISNSTISGNTATKDGGGIFFGSPGTATMSPATIDSNVASGNGGGIEVSKGTLTIGSGSTVESNQANGAGGGINISGGTGHAISGSTLAGNSATGSGGGINVAASFADTLTLSGDNIGTAALPNTAATGGGIAISGGTVAFTNTTGPTTIADNIASTGSGGGIDVGGGESLTIPAFVTLSANSAAKGAGGGLAIESGYSKTVTLTGATVGGATPAAGNTAQTGGGVNISSGSTATLNVQTGSTIENNAATANGGGIDVAGGTAVTISGSTVAGNSATADGGGIDVAASFANMLTIDGDSIGTPLLPNTAARGGGMAIAGGTVTFANTTGSTTIGNNSASSGSGGGVDLTGGNDMTIPAFVTLTANSAALGAGGGLAIESGYGNTVALSGTTVGGATPAAGNTAQAGGGVSIASGSAATLNIQGGSAIENNSATADGGGINLAGGSAVTISGSTIAGNSATANGGGIDVAASFANTLTLDGDQIGTPILSNSAASGGGIASAGGTVTFTNATGPTTIGNNSASTGSGGGIDLAGGNDLTIPAFVTLTANSAALGAGGGLAIESGYSHTVTLSGTTVGGATPAAGNTAQTGGGVSIASGSTATLDIQSATTIGSNAATGNGGGINISGGSVVFASPTVTAGYFAGLDATITGNNAFKGGGINIDGGSLSMDVSTVSGNVAVATGGGLNADAGTIDLSDSTFSGNLAALAGAGLYFDGGTASLTNVTVAGNGNDGIDVAGGSLTLSQDTIAFNQAGGVNVSAGMVTATASLFANSPAFDYQGALISNGSNLFQNFNSGNATDIDLNGHSALLAVLANYGGPTQTVALLPGSAALDAVTGPGGGTDGRGVTRPINQANDIGAFESHGFALSVPAGAPAAPSPAGDSKYRTLIDNFFVQGDGLTPQNFAVLVQDIDPLHLEPVAGGVVSFSAATGASGDSALAQTPAAVIAANGSAQTQVKANGKSSQTGTSYSFVASVGGKNTPVTWNLFNQEVTALLFDQAPQNTNSGQGIAFGVAGNTMFHVTMMDQDSPARVVALTGMTVNLQAVYNNNVVTVTFAASEPKLVAHSKLTGTNPGVSVTKTSNTMQTISFTGAVAGGTFTLSLSGSTTAAIAWSSNPAVLASNIQAALATLVVTVQATTTFHAGVINNSSTNNTSAVTGAGGAGTPGVATFQKPLEIFQSRYTDLYFIQAQFTNPDGMAVGIGNSLSTPFRVLPAFFTLKLNIFSGIERQTYINLGQSDKGVVRVISTKTSLLNQQNTIFVQAMDANGPSTAYDGPVDLALNSLDANNRWLLTKAPSATMFFIAPGVGAINGIVHDQYTGSRPLKPVVSPGVWSGGAKNTYDVRVIMSGGSAVVTGITPSVPLDAATVSAFFAYTDGAGKASVGLATGQKAPTVVAVSVGRQRLR